LPPGGRRDERRARSAPRGAARHRAALQKPLRQGWPARPWPLPVRQWVRPCRGPAWPCRRPAPSLGRPPRPVACALAVPAPCTFSRAASTTGRLRFAASAGPLSGPETAQAASKARRRALRIQISISGASFPRAFDHSRVRRLLHRALDYAPSGSDCLYSGQQSAAQREPARASRTAAVTSSSRRAVRESAMASPSLLTSWRTMARIAST
jgi:hypothetical protein